MKIYDALFVDVEKFFYQARGDTKPSLNGVNSHFFPHCASLFDYSMFNLLVSSRDATTYKKILI